MNSIIRWVGGATAAVLLGFTGAALATGQFSPSKQAPGLEMPAGRALFVAPRPAAKQTAAPATQAFTVKRILPIEGAIKYGEWHWDDAGVPDGPIVMTVDLDARVLSVFKGGYEIGAAAVLVGTDEYPTPLGTFPILA